MTEPVVENSVSHCPEWLVQILEWVQTISDLVGVAAVSIALLVGCVRFALMEIRLLGRSTGVERWKAIGGIRVFVGSYILLGLEFMIVSDIIHSFLKPDLDSLYRLGLTVVIRTAISFFLGKEIEGVIREGSLTPSKSP